MNDEVRSNRMSAVHDQLEPVAGQLIALGYSIENIADGFTMMALRLLASTHGRAGASAVLERIARRINEDDQAAGTEQAARELSFH